MSSSALIKTVHHQPTDPSRSLILEGCVLAFQSHLKTHIPPTSHGRLHGSFHHPHQELETLGVLSQPRCKGCQGVRVTSKVLEGNTLSEVCLETQEKNKGSYLLHWHPECPWGTLVAQHQDEGLILRTHFFYTSQIVALSRTHI